ncbi:hypothetical protein [Porphyromonas cangingivalis]|uniref:Uncharacterized protein n=1 Tax=Porphyromonas cangingivalis TaxID=36874 RepID=A0A1T4K0Q3_PORCN|nr:hypothetical protein [Porphyromonas cangingivalis]SJZ35958.1 hypothetical protein SAMN02745205_00491 [Porphyromonas cangingivalis]VEJ03321.1 Uncharacterised protein [Porphyromonas cangingivalis]
MMYFRWGTADSPSLSKAVSESVESDMACAMLWAYPTSVIYYCCGADEWDRWSPSLSHSSIGGVPKKS